jgi:hypothetical protein
MGRAIHNVRKESLGDRATMVAHRSKRQRPTSSGDESEAESAGGQSTSTRVSRSQEMSTDLQDEIKVEKEFTISRSGRRMCPL